ncbi:MAG TPA: hypothetical protein VNS34_10525 [Rhizobiaceae bacterium]|nr:hypothetical protein [Rhizobiaceae bacterium]
MIDLAQIIEKIEARIAELGMTAAEVSAKATDSKDTIRNWKRAVEADRRNGTNKASATTIKLNQVEAVLGIELARNGSGATPEAQLRSALLAFGVDAEDLGRAVSSVKVFVDDHDEQSSQGLHRDQSSPSNGRREVEPSR